MTDMGWKRWRIPVLIPTGMRTDSEPDSGHIDQARVLARTSDNAVQDNAVQDNATHRSALVGWLPSPIVTQVTRETATIGLGGSTETPPATAPAAAPAAATQAPRCGTRQVA